MRDMIRKLLIIAGAMAVALSATVALLYFINSAPGVPTLSAAEAAAPTKPFVIKLHAQWCPYCLLTKDEWARVEQAYAGRVNFVVLDATNEAAIERSRVQAERLNMRQFFDDYKALPASWSCSTGGQRKCSRRSAAMRRSRSLRRR